MNVIHLDCPFLFCIILELDDLLVNFYTQMESVVFINSSFHNTLSPLVHRGFSFLFSAYVHVYLFYLHVILHVYTHACVNAWK